MNVAIVGRSHINSVLQEKLSEEGLIPVLFEDIDEITGFSGQKLDYTVRTAKLSLNAGYIIITDELHDECSLKCKDKFADSGKPVVFILDHPSESPAYLTVEALKGAIDLVKRKTKVFYLSRFMRTAGNKIESLYKEARNIGVSFIKFRDLSVEYDKTSGIYTIEAFDGYDSIRLETSSVITSEGMLPDSGMDGVTRVFRLKHKLNGSVNEDKSFLFPSLTSRDGVYFLNSTSITDSEDILEHIRFTIAVIKNGINGVPNDKYADIDEGKCAFCYTCFRACPHSAMAPDYEKSIMKNLKNNCKVCGICVSVCPADAVKIVPNEPAIEKPEARQKLLKIFCCEHSGYIAVKKIKEESGELFEKIDTTPVSCGGEISVEKILSELGMYEKVLVITCMDEACKHFEGNKRAERFVWKAREMLKASGMDENRLEFLKISHAMPHLLNDQINEMIHTAAFTLQ